MHIALKFNLKTVTMSVFSKTQNIKHIKSVAFLLISENYKEKLRIPLKQHK